MGLVKVKAVGMKGECEWDHKGRTQIVQIIKSYSCEPIVIGSLQFQYLENGHVHISEIIGNPDFDRPNLDTIIFQGSHEHITKVEGYSGIGVHGSGLVRIGRLTIHTSEKVYKIFDAATSRPDNFSFNFGGENQFGGFHGTYSPSLGLTSIGVYFNHLTALPATYSHAPLKRDVHDQGTK